MKIVQFKNGKYGVRRLSIFGYVYLDDGRQSSYQNKWWTVAVSPNNYQFDSFEQAQHAYDRYIERHKPRLVDYGTPVTSPCECVACGYQPRSNDITNPKPPGAE